MILTLPNTYLPKVGSESSIATKGKILQNRGDFEFAASALAYCYSAWQEFQKFSFFNDIIRFKLLSYSSVFRSSNVRRRLNHK